MLTKLTEFVRGKLTHPSLDGEFNNTTGYINRRTLQNPLNRDLDFNGFLALNLRATKAFEIRDAGEFSSIQEAINDIGTGNPGVVWLPPDRTFVESATVTVPDDISIIGGGWGSVVRPGGATFPLFTIDGARVRLSNFKIDGNALTTSAVGAIVDSGAGLAEDVTIDNVWISSWGSGSALTNLRPGINMRVGITGVPGLRLFRNRITSVRGSGIVCGTASSTAATFSQMIGDNIIRSAAVHGIDIGNGRNILVSRNQILQSGYSGVNITLDPLGTGPFQALNFAISDNQIYQTGLDAGTLFRANGITGDLSTAAMQGLRIARNQINNVLRAGHASAHGKGIFLLTNAGSLNILVGITIQGNQIYLTTEDGIRYEHLAGNQFTQGVSIDDNLVLEFSADAGAWDGIVVRKSVSSSIVDISIRNNHVARNTGGFADGIDVTDNVNNNLITGIIHGNGVYGGPPSGRAIRVSAAEQVVVGINAVSGGNSLVQ